LTEWVFHDLLRFLFPDADRVFDLKAPVEFMDKELAQLCAEPKGKATIRFVDKLVKVKLKNRPRAYALIHLEIQGQTKTKERPFFGERMFRYFNLIFAKHPYSPLASIAIFTGKDGHLLSKGYTYSFMGTRLPYRCNTINIRDHSDELLGASANPFAWSLFVARQALLGGRDREKRLLEKKWFLFRKLYDNGLFDDRKLQAILVFMEDYLPFKDRKISRKFKRRINQFTGKKNTMDIFEQVAQMRIEEGRQLGQKEAKDMFVRDLLAGTEFSDEKIASLTRVSVRRVAAIRKKLRTKKR